MTAATESTDYADLGTEAAGRTLGGSIAGAIIGAGLGALPGFFVATSGEPQNGEKAGLIIAGGAGVGAVTGWFVGTGLGLKGGCAAIAGPGRPGICTVHGNARLQDR